MPTLNWIGKDAVLNHHKEVPFHLLKCDEKLSVAPKTSEVLKTSEVSPHGDNLLIQGDNLLALKALLPHYAGQVKCIYIDPPYNTGNEGWVYNDNVNSPEMKAWLGKVVGGESEDLSRHDKWLCMMYPRLVLLREMLSDDGIIFISIDDVEDGNLRVMLDEIFSRHCFIAKLIWKSRQYLDSRSLSGISTDHEYIYVYVKNEGKVKLKGKERDLGKYSNPDNDPRGLWMSRSILGLATKEQRPNLHYDLIDPATNTRYPCAPNTGWRYSKDTIQQKIEEGRILFPKKTSGRPREKVFLLELQTESTGFPSVIDDVFTAQGSAQIRQILGSQVFAFPKPSDLIAELIRQTTKQDDLILDSFAGSGTTGHAVLQMNQEDGGNRRFILVEMDENISKNITAERLKRVSQGYEWKDQKGNKKKEEGLGGGFRFCTLGETLFDSDGQIRREVSFEDLARHVYFTETGQPLPERPPRSGRPRRSDSPLLGVHNGVAVYLLYNGIMKDKSRDGGNVLTRPLLAELPEHDGAKVIYGNGTLLGENTLRSLGITFRQVPYEIKVS